MIGPWRTVQQRDAISWLWELEPGVGSVVTSPPDLIETGQERAVWEAWFRQAVRACMHAAGETCPTVFYVTDRRYQGELISKAGLIFEVARERERRLLWHKIALRLEPGTEDPRRPGYVHMLAVGGPKVSPGFQTRSRAVPDVFPMGERLHRNGMGLNAARLAIKYVGRYSSMVVNPFCGAGTVLAAAEEAGMHSAGVDLDPDCVERSLAARLP